LSPEVSKTSIRPRRGAVIRESMNSLTQLALPAGLRVSDVAINQSAGRAGTGSSGRSTGASALMRTTMSSSLIGQETEMAKKKEERWQQDSERSGEQGQGLAEGRPLPLRGVRPAVR
jgi:hypothetical protein